MGLRLPPSLDRRWATAIVLFAAWSLPACDVTSIVGFDDDPSSELHCGADDPFSACGTETCVVQDRFTVQPGAPSVGADDANFYYQSSPTVLSKQPIAGGEIVDLAELQQLERFTTDETSIYWSEFGGSLWSVAKSGGSPVLVAGELQANPKAIAVDAEYVYTVMPDSGVVLMTPKTPGTPTRLTGQASPVAIATDGTHVYWLNEGTSGPTSGEIVRAASGDLTTAEVILGGLETPVVLTVDATDIYWTSLDAAFRLPKGGGEKQLVAGNISEPKGLASYGGWLYLTGGGLTSGGGGLSRAPTGGGSFASLDNRGMIGLALACSGLYASGWFEDVGIRFSK